MVSALGIAAQTDVSDLVGSRTSNGESALRNRGYVYVNASNNNGRTYQNWWNPSSRSCINVVTRNNRYESINGASPSQCNQNGGWNGGNNGGNNGGWNGGNGNWNGNGTTSTPPSWAQGTFYGNGISLTIDRSGRVSVLNGGQSYYGTFYNNRIYLNGDTSTLSRNGNGIRTYNQSTGQTTNYSRDNNGWNNGNNGGGWNGGNNGNWNDDYGNWGGNGSMSAPPSWAQGRFSSPDGIELRIRKNGEVFVVNGGQTFYGRFYNNRIYLNGDASTISKTRNGFSTYNLNQRQTTYYTKR
jgi:hypothetical protein